MAGFYAVYHGAEGLRIIASRIHRLAALLALGLRQAGIELASQHFFDTIRFDLGKRAASRRGWDTRGRKVTTEMRQDILNSTDEPWQALADRLGVSKFVIYQVRKGLTHSAALPEASVFNWRP
jgi:glycine cleavage system pyridoxal-binding protein P